MSKQLKLSIGGRDLDFDFGVNWFLKFYGQATGSDPLNATDILISPEKQFDFVVNTLWAGHQSHSKATKMPCVVTRDEMEDLIGCEHNEFITDFIQKFAALNARNGEGNAASPTTSEVGQPGTT